MKEKIETMEKEEEKKWLKTRNEKKSIQEAQLMQKHKKERDAHNKRAQTAANELEKEKTKKMEKLMQSYNNVKKQTNITQKIEIAQMTKTEKKGSPYKIPFMGGDNEMVDSSPAKGS